MSYSVVLVEDERLVRDDLAMNTPWRELGLELVGTSSDGIDGEGLIRLLNPDIVVTDIRLPGQDGLVMLSKCHVNHAVILSGYTDFSYTRAAIRLGVWDYLQKPVDPKELNRTLTSLVERIRKDELEAGFRAEEELAEGDLVELPRRVNNHIINSVINFIVNNYSSSVGLQEAAQYLGISDSHLSRLFTEATGMNFLHYLNAYRVNKAARMMLDPRKNITEVALECGFPSPGYFAKIFKRFSGQTPTQYRDEKSNG